MLVTPEILRADKKIRGMLSSFDFEVQDPDYDAIWFDTAPLQRFEVVAAKGSGCLYALSGMQRHVLFVTSEGQAGVIAEDLNQCLELVIAYPYWEDVLRRSEGDLLRPCDGFFATVWRTSRQERSMTIRKSTTSGRCCENSLASTKPGSPPNGCITPSPCLGLAWSCAAPTVIPPSRWSALSSRASRPRPSVTRWRREFAPGGIGGRRFSSRVRAAALGGSRAGLIQLGSVAAIASGIRPAFRAL